MKRVHDQGIIQEFNLGFGSHVSITSCEHTPYVSISWGVGVGGAVNPLPYFAIYHF